MPFFNNDTSTSEDEEGFVEEAEEAEQAGEKLI